jgi:hypothetical protein
MKKLIFTAVSRNDFNLPIWRGYLHAAQRDVAAKA